jgi:glucokinase
MRVFAGDCGGTNTRLGIFELEAERWREIRTARFRNAEAESLDELVMGFLGPSVRGIDAGCLAVAGPVRDQTARLTNLPWQVDATAVGRAAGLSRFEILNDLEATGWGLPLVAADQICELNAGVSGAAGNGAVIAAGTGLGEAGLFRDGETFRPFATEGGHTSFSPTDRVGDDLLRHLRVMFETVSWERVVSGPGLAEIYRFLLRADSRPEPEWFAAADSAGDPVPSLVAAGIDGSCEICRAALELFACLYGEEAGNLALKTMARGGVWLAGGIAPKILPILQAGAFMRGFLNKGRMRPLLESMPVRVVLDDHAALRGAARKASVLVR